MSGLLVCVYTCAAHQAELLRFRASPVAAVLRQRADRTLEVLADPLQERDVLDGDQLTVACDERYDALSVKSHRMIRYCVENLSFTAMLKIDVTAVLQDMSRPEYAGRQPLDQEALRAFVQQVDLRQDYAGFLLHSAAGREGAEGWAAKKGGTIDYARLFGDGPMPPFYSGKCYLLGRRFAEFVAERGDLTAEEQRRHFLGSEDVMIGRLHQAFVGAA